MVLRDVTLYYNEQHPELRAAESGSIAEDNEGDNNTQEEDDASARTLCRTHTWTYRCNMHGTSMGTIHLSRNLADAHART